METPHGRFVEPQKVVSHFHLREGDTVADFGAGSGFFMKALAQAVGPEGRVYALDIQKNLVDTLAQTARESGLSNIEPMWCDLEEEGGTKLADGVLDAGVLVNTFFQLEDKKTALAEILRTLRSGGKFFVIDWTESFGGLGPAPDQVIDEFRAETLVCDAGFTLDRSFPAGAHHYGLAFRKP